MRLSYSVWWFEWEMPPITQVFNHLAPSCRLCLWRLWEGTTLLEEIYHWEGALRVYSLMLYGFMFAFEDVISQLLVCAAMSSCRDGLYPPGTIGHNNPFLLWATLGFYNNRKVTGTRETGARCSSGHSRTVGVNKNISYSSTRLEERTLNVLTIKAW